jgi:hypothetical protein
MLKFKSKIPEVDFFKKRHKKLWKEYGKRIYRRKFNNIKIEIENFKKTRFYGYID